MADLAKLAYNTYIAEMPFRALPAWERLPNDMMMAWTKAAEAAVDAFMDQCAEEPEVCGLCDTTLVCPECGTVHCPGCGQPLECTNDKCPAGQAAEEAIKAALRKQQQPVTGGGVN